MGMIALKDDRPFAPQANSEIAKRLQEIDPKLGFVYLPIGAGCWAITEKWGDNDPRRGRIRSGEISPSKDFDVLGFAPDGVTADDALALLLKKLQQKVLDQPEYDSMMRKVMSHNSSQAKANNADTREFASELVTANEEKIGSKIISRGAGFSMEGGKLVGTNKLQKLGLTKTEREARE